MFKCQIGNHTTKPSEPQVRLVVESRPVEYKDNNGRVIGKGTEIVRTIAACTVCASHSTLKRI